MIVSNISFFVSSSMLLTDNEFIILFIAIVFLRVFYFVLDYKLSLFSLGFWVKLDLEFANEASSLSLLDSYSYLRWDLSLLPMKCFKDWNFTVFSKF